MNPQHKIFIVIIAVLVQISWENAWGQESRPEDPRPEDPPYIENLKPKVFLQTKNDSLWPVAKKNTDLYFDTQLKLEKDAHVKLRFIQPGQDWQGRLLPASHDGEQDEGQYAILEDEDRRDHIVIKISRGSMIAETKKGAFKTMAGNIISTLTALSTSRALYTVKADSTDES